MKISVITVCLNSALTIEDTLRSVASQTHSDVEHIVIDGGSNDGTMAIVGRYRSHIANAVSECDRGIYDAMNKGLALATGEVVGFLNSDDAFATADTLAQVAAAFSDAEVDAVYGDLVYVDTQRAERVVRYWKSRPFEPGLFRHGWMPAHPTFYVRRSVFQRFGGFDLEFPRQADFELTTRFLEIGRIRAIYIPRTLVRMRVGGTSNNSIRGIIHGNIEAYRACRKLGLPVTWFFIVRKVMSRIPQFLARPSDPPETGLRH